MAEPIDFYFDFTSPYGYLASTRIDDLAARHGRVAAWRPILLGAVFKITGMQPLLGYPLKSDYVIRDVPRSARFFAVPFKLPAVFPFAAIAASRAFYWIAERDRVKARAFAQAVFRAGFGEGGDVTPAQTVAELAAAAAGIAREETLAALETPLVKDRLKTEIDAAIARGVFGSPYIVVDGEPFWGADRLDQVERWLATGGW